MNQQREHELLQDIGLRLLDTVEGPWSEILLTYDGLVSITTHSITVRRSDGDIARLEVPEETVRLLAELRATMYRKDAGTWFAMRYTITPPGSFSTDFDYDNPPRFPFELDPRSYYQDLSHFPRTFENSPEWLRGQIRTAIAMMREEPQPRAQGVGDGS